MHKVAVQALAAVPALAWPHLPTPGIAHVRGIGELSTHRPASKHAASHSFDALSSVFLAEVLDIHVAYHVVSHIVSNQNLINLTILGNFLPHFFKKVFELCAGMGASEWCA